MAGENPDDVTGGVEEFLSNPKWQRFIVAVMGPVMNGGAGGGPADRTVLLPIRGFPSGPGTPWVVGLIKSDSPALKSDLRPGDRIVVAGARQNPHPGKSSFWKSASVRGVPLPMQVQRGGQSFPLTLTPEARGRDSAGYLGIAPFELASVQVKEVLAGKPAAEARHFSRETRWSRWAEWSSARPDSTWWTQWGGTGNRLSQLRSLRNGRELEFQVSPLRGRNHPETNDRSHAEPPWPEPPSSSCPWWRR